jgi:PAS domain S-box-containing protein
MVLIKKKRQSSVANGVALVTGALVLTWWVTVILLFSFKLNEYKHDTSARLSAFTTSLEVWLAPQLVSNDYSGAARIMQAHVGVGWIREIYFVDSTSRRIVVNAPIVVSTHPDWLDGFAGLSTAPFYRDIRIRGRYYGYLGVVPDHTAFLNTLWAGVVRLAFVLACAFTGLGMVIWVVIKRVIGPFERLKRRLSMRILETDSHGGVLPDVDNAVPVEIRTAMYTLSEIAKMMDKKGQDALREIVTEFRDFAHAIHQSVGVVECNDRKRIIMVNDAMLDMTGFARKELEDQLLDTVFADHALDDAMWRSLSVGLYWKGDRSILSRGGRRLWVRMTAAPVRNVDGQTIKYLFMCLDVSAMKEMETRLTHFSVERDTMIGAMVRQFEHERRQIARELHDELGGALVSVKLEAELLRGLAEADQHIHDRVDSIIRRLNVAQREVRFLIDQLRPQFLDTHGLIESIQCLIDEWKRRMPKTKFEVSMSDGLDHVDDSTQVAVYRVVQEALTNAAKHSHAQNVSVEMTLNHFPDMPAMIYILIQDDGLGFVVGRAQGGIGLHSIQERVTALGGSVRVTSAPGAGTRIAVSLPVLGSSITHTETGGL